LAEQPSRLGIGVGSVRVFPVDTAGRHRSHSSANAPCNSQRTAGERRGDIRAANYGLIYAVLLGLLTVATFQTTRDLEDHIAEEASSLSAMYHSAEDYPEPLRSELRADLRGYTHYLIEKGWPAHRLGKTPKGGEHRLEAIRATLYAFEPETKTKPSCATKSSANSTR
jgi:hypothetical protein